MVDRGVHAVPRGGTPPGPQKPAAPRKKSKAWIGWLLIVVGVGTAAAFGGRDFGRTEMLNEIKRDQAAAASASAAALPPPGLYCPEPDSEEALTQAIRDKPVVIISKQPEGRVLVMRKAVTVVVRVELTSDLVVCGNDASLALEKTPRNSARILMQGGTDSKTKGAGPVIYMVDGVAPASADRVWFSNKNPQVVWCYTASPPVENNDVVMTPKPVAQRPCTSYFNSIPPTPSPRPTPSPKPTQ